MANIYSVGQINSYIRRMFTEDFLLSGISIRGEVSNCKYHSSGHIYFTLKDEAGVLSCVMFAGNRKGLAFPLKEGQTVVAEGSVNVYERDGKYQLYARTITLDGTGALYQRFEELKKQLEESGIFSPQYKKPIPSHAMRIGVVTAKTGAVIQDIRNIAERRNPYAQIYLYPAQVQGEGAAQSISEGIRYLDRLNLDVIIIGRGGGSIEDLWAFNEELVARAIFSCNTPVISAVGHETDTTISDYVADLRAPTPSAAAELAIFDYLQFEKKLEDYRIILNNRMKQKVQYEKSRLEQFRLRLKHSSPEYQLLQKKQYLNDLEVKIKDIMLDKIKDKKHRLAVLGERLHGLSPMQKLSKGFAFVTTQNHKPLTGVEQAELNESLRIQLRNGEVFATVMEIVEGGFEDGKPE